MATKKKKKPNAKIIMRKANKEAERKAKFNKENDAFLEKKLDIHMELGDGKEKIETFTIRELVNRIGWLNRGALLTEKFTMSMAKQFHAAVPSHPFFAGLPEKFMENLKDIPDPEVAKMLVGQAVVEPDTETRLNAAMKNLDNLTPAEPKKSGLRIKKDVSNGDLPVQD